MHTTVKDKFDKEEFTPEELCELDDFAQASVDSLGKSVNESKNNQKKPLELESPIFALAVLCYFSLTVLISTWIIGINEDLALIFQFGSLVPLVFISLYLKMRSNRTSIKKNIDQFLRGVIVVVLGMGSVLFNMVFIGIILIGVFLIYRSMQDIVYSVGLVPILLLTVIFLQAKLIQDNSRKEQL